jgi:Flp pilus assembly protein TadD
MLTSSKAGRKEFAVVAVLWGVLMAAAVTAVMLLHANAYRIIHHIEVVRASRHQRTLTVYEEMTRHARRVLEKYSTATGGSKPPATIPATDPDYKSAVDLFDKACAMDTRDRFAPERREYYELMAHVCDAAGEELTREIMLAKGMIAAGRPKLAIPHVQAALTSAPSDLGVRALAAEAYLRAGERDRLDGLLAQMEGDKSADALVSEIRGRLALEAGEITTATQYFEHSVLVNSGNVGLRKRLADLYAGEKNWAAVVKVLHGGMPWGGADDPGYLHLYGIALLELNQPGEAIPPLKEAARLEPSSSSVRWDLARAYQKSGDVRRAHESLRDAIRLDPKLQNRILE